MFFEETYWIWLQHAFGAGSAKPVWIGKKFKDIEEFAQGGKRLWSTMSFISEKELAALSTFTLSEAEAQLEYSEKVGQQVIAYCNEDYPEKLRNIPAPPAVLYVKGEMPDFDSILTISVVGSREATESAVQSARMLCYELSKAGAIIVSGGALGIDAAAHRGAMMGAAPTVCILACGIGYPYLMENYLLRSRVVEKGGALITEYPENTGVFKGTFTVRNRIISGLCTGLLVVEAEEKSGTMLTVSHAVKQNKDIFALPGDVNNPMAKGTNNLIRDGAIPVIYASDILDVYSGMFEKATTPEFAAVKEIIGERLLEGASANAEIVYRVLNTEPMHISKVCEKTGLKVSSIYSSVTELELLGYIRSFSGQRYCIIPNKNNKNS